MLKKWSYLSTVLLLFMFVRPLSADFPEQDPFTISYSYQNLLSNSEGTGMLDRILHEAFRRLGIEMEIVFIPTEKSLVDANAGVVDAEINRIEGMEKSFPNLVRVPEPNMVMHFVAFSKNKFEIEGWESLRGLYTGIVKGWKILERNTEGFPNVIYTPTEFELFRMLEKDRLDIALYSLLTGYAVLDNMGYENIRDLHPPLASREMYLYVHKKHADLVEDIAAALRSMKSDGTYDRIVAEATAGIVPDEERR